MKRKILRIGSGSLAVTLPKNWVKLMNLSEKDNVEVEEFSSSLIIRPEKTKEEEKTAYVKTCGDSSFLRRIILDKYLGGHQTMIVTGKQRISLEERNAIDKVVKSVIGLEVVEETADKIVIKDLSNPSVLPLENGLKRMRLLVSGMLRDLILALETKNFDLFKQLLIRDRDVDRLYFLIVKQIRSVLSNPTYTDKLGVTLLKSIDYRLFAKEIEAAGDEIVKLSSIFVDYWNEELDRFVREMVNILKRCYDHLINSSKSFFDSDMWGAFKELCRLKDTRKKMRELESKVLKENSDPIIWNLFNSLNRIIDCLKDIGDLTTVY